MSRDRLADAYEEQAALYARLADATAQISHELRGIEPAVARAADEPGAAGADVSPPARSAAPADIPMKPQVDTGLGKCPVHGLPWTIKAGGISKNGKPYKAFWRCNERDANGYCNEKPQPIWAQTHSAEVAA